MFHEANSKLPEVCTHFMKILNDCPEYLLNAMPYQNAVQQLYDVMVSDSGSVGCIYTDSEINDIFQLLRMYNDDHFNNEIQNLTSTEIRFRLIELNRTLAQVQQKGQIHSIIQSKRSRTVNQKMSIIFGLSAEELQIWCSGNPMQNSYRLPNRRRTSSNFSWLIMYPLLRFVQFNSISWYFSPSFFSNFLLFL